MKPDSKSNHTNNKLAALEKLKEREIWYKLVVKIIFWKSEQLNSGAAAAEKITPTEWHEYFQSTIKTHTTISKEKVLSNLKQIEEVIKRNGGFV